MQFGLIATFLQTVWLLLDFCSSKWILGSHFHTLGKNITTILVGIAYSNLIITAFVISSQYRLIFDDCHFIYPCFKWAFLHWLYFYFLFLYWIINVHLFFHMPDFFLSIFITFSIASYSVLVLFLLF